MQYWMQCTELLCLHQSKSKPPSSHSLKSKSAHLSFSQNHDTSQKISSRADKSKQAHKCATNGEAKVFISGKLIKATRAVTRSVPTNSDTRQKFSSRANQSKRHHVNRTLSFGLRSCSSTFTRNSVTVGEISIPMSRRSGKIGGGPSHSKASQAQGGAKKIPASSERYSGTENRVIQPKRTLLRLPKQRGHPASKIPQPQKGFKGTLKSKSTQPESTQVYQPASVYQYPGSKIPIITGKSYHGNSIASEKLLSLARNLKVAIRQEIPTEQPLIKQDSTDNGNPCNELKIYGRNKITISRPRQADVSILGQAKDFSMDNSQINVVGGAQYNTQNYFGQQVKILLMRLSNSDIHFATPPPPKIFTGRDDLVNEGVEILCRRGQHHLAILGPGGIGKTSLALVISNQPEVQAKFPRFHFLPCDILEDQNGLIQGLIQVLGLKVQEGKGQHDILYDYLQINHNPLLFILDNFETPWNYKDARTDVKHFIEKIADFSCVTLIVTVRGMEGPGDIEWQILGESQIPTLSMEAAREAFYQVSRKIKTEDNSGKIDHLNEQLDCVPLAIRLIAQLAKKISLENLLRRWNELKTKILSESGAQPGKLTNVEFSIELSVRLLDPAAKDLLGALSYLPNGVPNWNQTLSEMLPDVPDPEIKVFQLLDCSLVLEKSEALMMLAPVREYIAARYSISDFLLHQIEIFYVRITELISSDSKPGEDLELHTLNLFKTFSQYQGQGGQEKAALCLQTLGDKYYFVSQYSNAAKFLTEARVKFQNINNEHEAANCLRQMGNIHGAQSRYNEAIAILAEAKSRFEQIRSEKGIAHCLWSLGETYRMQGKYNEATAALSEARVLFQSIGNQGGAANCLMSQGDIYCMQSKL
ncbi:hypothetical protein D9758_018976 [Tetrapyrgos nigripes]|uniref:Uncharacterized protein n=1 Tax=Tetrapyrgos nigripes TaxID=182062 RepID=A0A8H5BAW4_9AGAR|nr:hypothetical protein D9758_018976 [Tetrapyrgos nigripes]